METGTIIFYNNNKNNINKLDNKKDNNIDNNIDNKKESTILDILTGACINNNTTLVYRILECLTERKTVHNLDNNLKTNDEIQTIEHILTKKKHNLYEIGEYINKGFIVSCETGHIDIVKIFIDYIEKNNICISLTDTDGSALIKACYFGYIGVVKYILDHGFSKSGKNIHLTSIHALNKLFGIACKYGHLNIVDLLTKYCDEYGNRVDIHYNLEYGFRIACENGFTKIVKYLIEYSELINSSIDIHVFDDMTFLLACNKNYYEITKCLILYCEKLNKKINIHGDRNFAFRNSITNNNIDSLKYLIYLFKHNYHTYDHKYTFNIFKNGLYCPTKQLIICEATNNVADILFVKKNILTTHTKENNIKYIVNNNIINCSYKCVPQNINYTFIYS